MIYAKQIPPEYQESPLYWSRNPRTRELDLADTWPGVSLTGNRHLCGYTAEEYDDAERATNEAAEEYNNGKEWTGERVTLRDALRDYGIEKRNGKQWSPRELGQWKRLFEEYDRNPYDRRNAERRLLTALQLITGEPYERDTLRGCSQGDYIECTYPRNKYSAADLARLEKEYFNTGEEWTIYDDDPNENPDAESFSMYVYSWDDDEKRKEIAAAAGVDPAEVELHAFTGWSRSACYA